MTSDRTVGLFIPANTGRFSIYGTIDALVTTIPEGFVRINSQPNVA